MKDKDKTQEQLINELLEIRQRVAQLEILESEHEQLVDTLRESEEKYRTLVEDAAVGIMKVDNTGKINYVNQTILQSTGYSWEELIDKNVFRLGLFSGETIRVLRKRMTERLMGQPPGLLEIPFKRKDGEWIWLQIRGRVLWKHNIPVGIQIIGDDITERKRMEERLKKSEAQMQALLDGSPDMIRQLDRDMRIVWANKTALDINPDAIGQTCYKAYLNKDEPCKGCPCKKAMDTGRIEMGVMYHPWTRATHGESYWEDIGVPIRGSEGKVVGVVEIVRDITERKRAEEREEQLQQELNLASRLATVGTMSAGIAHEINNPLTGVIGFSDLLLKKDLPENIRKDVDIIHEGAQRIASITERMLTFAHQRKSERTSVNINDIIEITLAMRAYEMESSNIKVTTELAPDIPLTFADASQLQQVFLNIILNAEMEMNLAHARGNLTVKTERIDNTIRVSFKDDGPGISKKNLDRLFDPFFTTRDPDKGTGLGLSICYSMVTRHGGKIYARSRLGKGATFFVELPTVTEEEQLKMAEPVTEVSKTLPRGRILVVDDDTIVQEFLTEILGEEGHEVEIVDNGNDALERLGSEDYDVILLDIKLPGMSGIELYEYMQKAVKSLARRVVFITGDVMSADTMVFIRSAGTPYITKPFDAEQLKKNINRILSQRA